MAQIADGLSLLVDAEGTLKRSTGTPSNKTIATQVASYGDDGKKMLLASIVAIDTEMKVIKDAKRALSLQPRGPLSVPRTDIQDELFEGLQKKERSLRDLRKIYEDVLFGRGHGNEALGDMLRVNKSNLADLIGTNMENKFSDANMQAAKEKHKLKNEMELGKLVHLQEMQEADLKSSAIAATSAGELGETFGAILNAPAFAMLKEWGVTTINDMMYLEQKDLEDLEGKTPTYSSNVLCQKQLKRTFVRVAGVLQKVPVLKFRAEMIKVTKMNAQHVTPWTISNVTRRLDQLQPAEGPQPAGEPQEQAPPPSPVDGTDGVDTAIGETETETETESEPGTEPDAEPTISCAVSNVSSPSHDVDDVADAEAIAAAAAKAKQEEQRDEADADVDVYTDADADADVDATTTATDVDADDTTTEDEAIADDDDDTTEGHDVDTNADNNDAPTNMVEATTALGDATAVANVDDDAANGDVAADGGEEEDEEEDEDEQEAEEEDESSSPEDLVDFQDVSSYEVSEEEGTEPQPTEHFVYDTPTRRQKSSSCAAAWAQQQVADNVEPTPNRRQKLRQITSHKLNTLVHRGHIADTFPGYKSKSMLKNTVGDKQ